MLGSSGLANASTFIPYPANRTLRVQGLLMLRLLRQTDVLALAAAPHVS